jgi:hypothetical protein
MPECRHCNTYWEYESDADTCCESDELELDGSEGTETADSAVSVPKIELAALTIPELADRPARLVSIEQETVGSSGFTALEHMYRAGIAVSRNGGYADSISEAPGGRKIYATDDPTCGAELTYSLLQPQTQADAIILGTGLEIASQYARLSFSCGFHTHVSARTIESGQWLSQDAVLNSRAVFSGMEDLLYRIASARWSQHRTENGSDYANPGPYVENTVRKYEKLQLISGGRYFGLNVSPYIGSRRDCNCEAGRWGFWGECSCTLEGTPTLEFRLWNATANPVKVQAYIALSLAIVSYGDAIARGDAEPVTREVPFRSTSRRNLESLQTQLALLARLPLNSDERQAVAYCLTHSSASELGAETIASYAEGSVS